MLEERFRTRGLTQEEAWYAARRQFGNSTSLKQARNEMQKFVRLETLVQDVRYGARMLAKNKGFAALAVITLRWELAPTPPSSASFFWYRFNI